MRGAGGVGTRNAKDSLARAKDEGTREEDEVTAESSMGQGSIPPSLPVCKLDPGKNQSCMSRMDG